MQSRRPRLRALLVVGVALLCSRCLGKRAGRHSKDPQQLHFAGQHAGQQHSAGQQQREHGRPAAFAGCGNWQESYAQLHNNVITGAVRGRYLVSVGRKGGWPTTWWARISTSRCFSGRAFQISDGGQPGVVRFAAAFDAPHVDWRRGVDPQELVEKVWDR
jgi:hypothetical protein